MLEILLCNAIENNQLAIFLQSKYSFADRSVVGAESLVRLYNENGRVIGTKSGFKDSCRRYRKRSSV